MAIKENMQNKIKDRPIKAQNELAQHLIKKKNRIENIQLQKKSVVVDTAVLWKV